MKEVTGTAGLPGAFRYEIFWDEKNAAKFCGYIFSTVGRKLGCQWPGLNGGNESEPLNYRPMLEAIEGWFRDKGLALEFTQVHGEPARKVNEQVLLHPALCFQIEVDGKEI